MSKTDADVNEHYVYQGGGSLYVLDYAGEEPAIVLMHGFPDDHRIYDKLAPLLSPRRVVTFDWLGYGRSDRIDKIGPSSDDHGSELERCSMVWASPAPYWLATTRRVPTQSRSPSRTPSGWLTWSYSTPCLGTNLRSSFLR